MHITDPCRIGRYWLFADGTVLPVISGGDGDEDGGGDEGQGEQGSKGGQPKFTPEQQEHIDRIVRDRLTRVKSQPPPDYDDLKAKAARLEEIEEQTKSDKDKAVDRATKDADTAARRDERSKSDARVIRAEVKAAAGTKLQDPTDAVRLLDLSQFKVDDDGEVDGKAIATAIADLLKEKPYLAAGSATGNGKKDAPDLGQGRREGAPASSVAAGRERGKAVREAEEANRKDPFAGMRRVGGPYS